MSPSTRIIFNNQMDDFSTPNVTNNYGIPPSEHNFIVPGKRPTSSMAPSIIVDNNNKVKLVLGASGGPRIISAVAYVSFKIAGLAWEQPLNLALFFKVILSYRIVYFVLLDCLFCLIGLFLIIE